ncbi:DEKNAAC103151 [Brettanomyces naardenensis]|uniref:DEKNAAC103151 n=1 Tax=Brettanomyces naardenensis TaxID=13370 RepID=A0A448YMN4_BRENA|nr:DEKNAAC103151 [Brettanomyces naardenensis]
MPSNAKLDTLFFNVTPFRDIRAVSSFFALPFSKEIAYDLKLDLDADKEQYRHDLISVGLIDYDTALELIRLFAQYYGRWTSFPLERSPKDLLDSIRLDSSLLLAVCCLMGLIHYKGDKVKTPSKDLNLDILREISSMLSLTVNYVPQTKQLLQSLVILSSFSMSLSYKNVYFDGWYLSGYALLHFISREMDLNLLSDRFKSHPDRINNFRLWNHLALTHITFCVLSGRPCLIDTLRMDQCREILQIPAATSFDGRVVAELSIILSLYNALQFEEPIEMSLREIDSAYEDWKYLRDQKPLGVFVEMDYRFSRLMIYRRSFLKDFGKDKGFIYHSPLMLDGEFPRNGIKEEGVDSLKKIVRPMIEECIRVIELAYNGDRMELIRCTDSIKFEIFFATVVMINMKRCGFGSLQSEINEAIVKSKEICEWLSSHGVYYNKFVESYYALISKFSDNIHEQEV